MTTAPRIQRHRAGDGAQTEGRVYQARSPAEARALAAGEMFRHAHAVHLQARRVLAATNDLDREIDTGFFAYALRDLIRAAVMATKLGLPVQAAVDRFTAQFPHAIDVRELLGSLMWRTSMRPGAAATQHAS